MKHVNLLIAQLLLLMLGQSAQAQCICESIGVGKSLRVVPDTNERSIQRLVDKYRSIIPEKQRPAITVKINTTNCLHNRPALAKICESVDKGYIFYDKNLLSTLRSNTKYGADFIVAHEIAHYLWGHATEIFYMEGQDELKGTTDALYRSGIPRRHLHELEADALGLRMIRLKGANRSQVHQAFAVLIKQLYVKDVNQPGISHPSWSIRQKLVLDQWDREEIQRQGRSVTYTASGTELPEFTRNDGESTRREVGEAYAFYLQNPNEIPSDSLNSSEQAIRKSLLRRARFFFIPEPVLGVQWQRPVLFRKDSPILATDSWSTSVGFRIGIRPWYRRYRFETDLLYSVTAFNTQTVADEQPLSLESFRMHWLSVRPRFVVNILNGPINRSPFKYHTHGLMGLMGTIGFSFKKNIGFDYKNFGVDPYQSPALHDSFSLVAGIGYSLSNWNSRNGLYRVWVMYEPQVLKFQAIAPDSIRAMLHTFSIEVSARFW